MKHIPEHYQVSAVPVGGGERVTGYYAEVGLHRVVLTGQIVKDKDNYLDWERREVDPATVEPVKTNPIFDPNEYLPESIYCPNCNYDLMGGIEPDAEHDPPYCWECGQALDWED